MTDQLTVRLPAELSRQLTQATQRLQRKRSEIVRLALVQFLGLEPPDDSPVDRVRELLGSVDSGVGDLAERHREYVLDSLKHGR